MPGVVDRHVHLGLVDLADLAESPVVEVHDLGWEPEAALGWRGRPPSGLQVRVAGPFHTAPGGYPSGRSWAPEASIRAVDAPAAARRAVTAVVAAGYDLVKVALNADMALLDDATLAALVAAAHDAGLPVAVHAEGEGQVARAVEVGADLLAHAPWTESVPDELLRRGRSMTWCSTLAIHDGADRERALDNVRRFRALGGRVVYGTDAGNGPAPAGVNPGEIRALGEAGLAGDELLVALTGVTGPGPVPVDRLLVSPRPLPTTAEETIAWLADCRRLTAAPLEEIRA
ncbi:hydrolase [Nocardioides daphniae]|nr:hydrolase [Nocardioides daphniae]